jgi:hypothetical protein
VVPPEMPALLRDQLVAVARPPERGVAQRAGGACA